ncbi:interleukin-25-like [Scomber scombrus]|uniref:Interleukin-25-like n=1 Tax=Scomber scombrus TaxID=13677 RepID=A0AAV1Q7Y9_SCOSC
MQTSSTAPATGNSTCTTCISMNEFNDHAGRYRTWHMNMPQPPTSASLQDSSACQKAAKEIERRAAPTRPGPMEVQVSIDTDNNRIPHEIAVAECLCRGCIINQREEHDYNSVPVQPPLMVLRKSRCPHNPDKYVFKTEFILITVACTCVVPDV